MIGTQVKIKSDRSYTHSLNPVVPPLTVTDFSFAVNYAQTGKVIRVMLKTKNTVRPRIEPILRSHICLYKNIVRCWQAMLL